MSTDYSQIPWCVHCVKPQSEHADNIQCLYQPTRFKAAICPTCRKFIPSSEGTVVRSATAGGIEYHHIDCAPASRRET